MSENEAAGDRIQINFEATESQKESWMEYADESGFRSFSEFLRTTIESEVNGDASGDESAESGTEKTSEVIEGLNRIEARMHDLDNRLGTIESEVREDPEIRELASEIFSVLPTRKELIAFEKTVQQAGAYPEEPLTHSGKVEHIASHLDEEPHRIEQGLEKLQEDTHQVGTLILNEAIEGWSTQYDDGEVTRYYKEG